MDFLLDQTTVRLRELFPAMMKVWTNSFNISLSLSLETTANNLWKAPGGACDGSGSVLLSQPFTSCIFSEPQFEFRQRSRVGLVDSYQVLAPYHCEPGELNACLARFGRRRD